VNLWVLLLAVASNVKKQLRQQQASMRRKSAPFGPRATTCEGLRASCSTATAATPAPRTREERKHRGSQPRAIIRYYYFRRNISGSGSFTEKDMSFLLCCPCFCPTPCALSLFIISYHRFLLPHILLIKNPIDVNALFLLVPMPVPAFSFSIIILPPVPNL